MKTKITTNLKLNGTISGTYFISVGTPFLLHACIDIVSDEMYIILWEALYEN